MSGIEVSRRIRIFLANLALAIGWTLKSACKPCAQTLFTTARWLVPEAQRFLVQGSGALNRNQLSFEWLRSRIQLRVVAHLLVALAFWGALNFVLKTTTNHTQPLLDNPALQEASQASPGGNVVSVRKSSQTQDPAWETGSISEAQPAPVQLPHKKPARVSKVANGKGAKAIPAAQKRTAPEKKRVLPKPTP